MDSSLVTTLQDPMVQGEGRVRHPKSSSQFQDSETGHKVSLCPLYCHNFPCGTGDKEPACQCRRHKKLGLSPWVGKIPCRRAWQPTPVFLPGESHEQRRLVGYSSQGHEESDTTELTQHTHTHTQSLTLRVTALSTLQGIDTLGTIFREKGNEMKPNSVVQPFCVL